MATVLSLCDEEQYPGVRQEISDAKLELKKGHLYKTAWSTGNVMKVQVGDRAYFQRTGTYPHGFFAAGYVTAASKDKQIRLKYKQYSHVSEAYEDILYVSIHIDSVVDYDYPLEQEKLKKLPQFREAQFFLRQGGCEFNPICAPYLDSEWEKHSLELSRKGFGIRLVDVFFERGQEHRKQGDYQAAIEAYDSALLVDKKYPKAINAKQICEKLLSKAVAATPPPKSSGVPLVNPEERAPTEVNEEALELNRVQTSVEEKGFFNPNTIEDARERILASIVQRKGQSEFRRKLLETYDGKCCVTSCDVEVALEAAHIVPYNGTQTNHVSNGLLLRADIHTLFDLHLISIHPDTEKIVIASALNSSHYLEISGKSVQKPNQQEARPNRAALRQHYDHFCSKQKGK